MNRDQELEAFKRLPINQVAAVFGYKIDRKKSSRHSAVMIRGVNDKIVCSTSSRDGHGIFFSVNDNSLKGSIIDLVQNVTGGNLGRVRVELRPFLDNPGMLPSSPQECGEELRPTSPDFLAVMARYSSFEVINEHQPYLCDERKIPIDMLLSERFHGRVRHDPVRGGVVFPHFGSPDGSLDRVLTGYEIRGVDLNVFSKGGRKGLWPSNAFEQDERLCICESSIDALSYAVLKVGAKLSRFVSIGGQLNPEQPTLIASAIEKLPRGEVVAAVDNDEGGDQLADKITAVFNKVGRSDLSLRIDVPEIRGIDWNKVLLSQPEPGR